LIVEKWSLADDGKRAAYKRLVTQLLEGDATASRMQRQDAFANALPSGPVQTLIDKVATKPSRVSDKDIVAAKAAGLSEDQIFELVICGAVGQAARQYDAGLRALDAELIDRGDPKRAS
jgi:hypothetical protein